MNKRRRFKAKRKRRERKLALRVVGTLRFSPQAFAQAMNYLDMPNVCRFPAPAFVPRIDMLYGTGTVRALIEQKPYVD